MPRNPAADAFGKPLVIANGHGSMLDFTTPGDWAGQFAPDRAWLVPDWVPDHRATLLTGDGGSGKSLLAQQLATCAAAGVDFLGATVERRRAMYLTCEDDLDELHRRQEGINRANHITMATIEDSLFLVSRVGQLDNSLLQYVNDGEVKITKFFHQIEATAKANGIAFVVLDNVAHLFEGNENIRNHVATFCNLMEQLARSINGAVLFLAHPAKSGAQFSGSTAWENQVRSRLFLERPKHDDSTMDQASRTLTRSKANYAQTGATLEMHWHDWGFIGGRSDHGSWQSEMAANERAIAENDRFMELLRLRITQGRPVSGRVQARNYAPREFEKMPSARRMNAAQFERAMERLQELGLIREVDVKGNDRHVTRCLLPIDDVRASCGSDPTDEITTPQTQGNPGLTGCGPDFAGQSAGQTPPQFSDTSKTPGNAGLSGAGQLRGRPPLGVPGQTPLENIYSLRGSDPLPDDQNRDPFDPSLWDE